MLQPIMHVLNAQRVVLASGSPRRKQILQNVGLKVEVIPSTFDEKLDKSLFPTPGDYVQETALQKALEVLDRLRLEPTLPDLVIGADTVISMDGKIFEKPKDKQDAYNMLTGFSGRSHSVYTGVVLITSDESGIWDDASLRVYQFHVATEVTMANLTSEIVKSYIETGEPMDKAGGYGIQAIGGTIVEKINGEYFNVMGFPVCRFAQELLKLYKYKF